MTPTSISTTTPSLVKTKFRRCTKTLSVKRFQVEIGVWDALCILPRWLLKPGNKSKKFRTCKRRLPVAIEKERHLDKRTIDNYKPFVILQRYSGLGVYMWVQAMIKATAKSSWSWCKRTGSQLSSKPSRVTFMLMLGKSICLWYNYSGRTHTSQFSFPGG